MIPHPDDMRSDAVLTMSHDEIRSELLNPAADEIDRLRGEMFLLWRRQEAKIQPTARRCWGVSSDALAWAAIHRTIVEKGDYPSDPSDLAACERTYRMAPDHLQRWMEPQMRLFVGHVEERYPGAEQRVIDHLASEERP